jgi:hypothetical protein
MVSLQLPTIALLHHGVMKRLLSTYACSGPHISWAVGIPDNHRRRMAFWWQALERAVIGSISRKNWEVAGMMRGRANYVVKLLLSVSFNKYKIMYNLRTGFGKIMSVDIRHYGVNFREFRDLSSEAPGSIRINRGVNGNSRKEKG